MILYLDGNDQDQQAAQALLQKHGFRFSLQSGDSAGAKPATAEEDLPLAFTKHFIDGIVILDTETAGVIYANKAFSEMLGYSLEEVYGLKVWDWDAVWSQEELERMHAARNWPGYRFETRHRRKDGQVLDVSISHKAIFWRGKEVVFCVVRDISDRKKNEHILHLTQVTVEKSIDQAFWLSSEGRIQYVNEAACASLGYSREELEGMSIWEVDPNLTREKYVDCWQQVKESGSIRFESTHRAKDGRIYPVEIRSNYVEYDGQEFSCAFATDISERKTVEKALRRSEERYRRLMEMLPIAAYTTDTEGRITFLNRSAKELWKREPELETERWCGSFKLHYPDGRPMAHDQCPMAITVKTGKAYQGREIMVENPDGSRSFALAFPEPLIGADGKMDGAVNLLFDITERKMAEQQMRQANLVLENSPAVLFRWKAQPGWPVEMVSRNISRFGYSSEELLSGAVSFAELVHPEDLDRVTAEVTKYACRGEDRFQQEYRIVTKQGEVRWIDDRTVVERDATGRVTHYQGIVIDITDRKRTELVMAARMRLLQFAATHNLDKLLEATLDEAEELTGSQIGFIGFLDEDEKTMFLQNWSNETKQNYCMEESKGRHYDLAEAGVWVDCVRQRRPVIHNDYAVLPHRKGLPLGHSPLVRELVVPVFRGEKIVAVLGVGNKPQAYTQQDVEMVSLLADLAWEITESKRAEEALRESERRYRSIVEHAPFGITRSTREGKLLSVNPALASILKYDSAQDLLETINRSNIQEVLFLNPADREPLVDKILANDSWIGYRNRLRCKDGSFVKCRVHSRRILDENDQTGVFESYQENITEQLAAEQALRESEEKFRVLAETSPVAICLYQGEYITYANPAMERLFGYSIEELSRRKCWEWVHEDDQEMVRSRARARLAGENVPGQYEAKFLSKASEKLHVLVSAGTMEYQGRSTGVASFLDITERKRTEGLIRASLEEKEVLLREIHHRVKNNLQVISSLLYLQSHKFKDAEVQNCFLESQSRICSMALAHEQLYQAKNLAEVSINSYVENLVGQLEQIFQSPEQEVSCQLAVEALPLDIEKVVPCGLLITELLSNAYKHAFVDGRSGKITISLQSSAGQIELTVADDGVGLPAELDYRQAKTLGLQLVRALVNQLGGSLDLEGVHGTCFRVSFAG